MGGVGESVKILAGKPNRPCDVGQVTYIDHDGQLASRFFVNIASAGLAGLVDATANNMWKGLGGKVSFSLASLASWVRYSNAEMEVVLDGIDEFSGRFQNVIVANGEYFGGGMWVAPGAEVDDGFFQVVMVGDLGVAECRELLSVAEKFVDANETRRSAE